MHFVQIRLLVACGGNPEVVSAAEESLGTQESAMCSGLSVSNLALSGASIYQGELAGSGPWAVSAGANAVRLEYSINNTLYASEERAGTSGTWYFSHAGLACGTYSLQVKAWPMVVDSAGNRTTCWAAPRTISQNVSQPCPGGTWTLVSTDNCYDLIGTSCYARYWSPSCPTSYNPEGTYCETCSEQPHFTTSPRVQPASFRMAAICSSTSFVCCSMGPVETAPLASKAICPET
ncbi:MAG TPA: hypothetical protein VEU50_01415 [Archangium sp.]|nr:hypothetical protein [Archangium sp.]HYO51432.1 hypothetical protein [Archangium sp.]